MLSQFLERKKEKIVPRSEIEIQSENHQISTLGFQLGF
jgi:hypothetical protein